MLVSNFGENNVCEAMEVRGYAQSGSCHGQHARCELLGQPTFRGVLGPMYDGKNSDGEAVIRYETQDVYNALSV